MTFPHQRCRRGDPLRVLDYQVESQRSSRRSLPANLFRRSIFNPRRGGLYNIGATLSATTVTFSGKRHVKRNKRVSNVLPQPEGHLEIFMTAFCRLNRSNPWRRFADTPQVSATCGCTSRAKYSSMRSASGTLSVARSSGSSSGWPSLSRQMMAASSRSERAERKAFCAEAASFRPACNVLASRGRRDSAGKSTYSVHNRRYRCSAHFSSSASFWMASVRMCRSHSGRSCG
jgi:hypothetical protein